MQSAFVIERKSKVFDQGCALVLANVRSIVLFTLNNSNVLMESQMKYSKVLTTLGLLVTVVLAGESFNPKKSLAAPYSYEVVNYWNSGSKCLDADIFNGRNGTVVQMWQCTNLDNQKWRFHEDGSIESARYPGMCLDADYFSGGNGTRIKLWRCATAINSNNVNHQNGM